MVSGKNQFKSYPLYSTYQEIGALIEFKNASISHPHLGVLGQETMMKVAQKVVGFFGILMGGGVILSLMAGRAAPWIYSVPSTQIATFAVGTGMLLMGALLCGEKN
jgi:hypothetical protein